MRGFGTVPAGLRPLLAWALAMLLLPTASAAELSPAGPPMLDVTMPTWDTLRLLVDLRFEGTPATQVRELLDFYGDRDDVVDAEEAAEASRHLEAYASQWTAGIRLDLAQPRSVAGLNLTLANATGPVSSADPIAAHFGAVLSFALASDAAAGHIVTLDLPSEAGRALLRFAAPDGFTVTTVQGFSDFALLGGGVGVEGQLRPGRSVTVQFDPGAPLPSDLVMPAPLDAVVPVVALAAGALVSRRRR